MKLLSLAWQVVLRNWVLWLLLFIGELLGPIIRLITMFRQVDTIQLPDADARKPEALVEGMALMFGGSLGLLSLVSIAFFIGTLYGQGVLRRLLYSGLTRLEAVQLQILVLLIVPVVALLVNLLLFQGVALGKLGADGGAFLSHVNWEVVGRGLLASIAGGLFFLLGVNILQKSAGVFLALAALVLFSLLIPMFAVMTEGDSYIMYFPQLVYANMLEIETPKISIFLMGLLYLGLLLGGNAALVLKKDK